MKAKSWFLLYVFFCCWCLIRLLPFYCMEWFIRYFYYEVFVLHLTGNCILLYNASLSLYLTLYCVPYCTVSRYELHLTMYCIPHCSASHYVLNLTLYLIDHCSASHYVLHLTLYLIPHWSASHYVMHLTLHWIPFCTASLSVLKLNSGRICHSVFMLWPLTTRIILMFKMGYCLTLFSSSWNEWRWNTKTKPIVAKPKTKPKCIWTYWNIKL